MAVSDIGATETGVSSPKGRTGTFWTEHPRLVVGLLLFAVWEATVRALAPAYVAKPTAIAVALPKVLADAAFWRSAGESLGAVAQGLAIAIVLGTLIGLFIGRLRIADAVLRHYISGFYAVPMVVALPLFSLWFGYTSAARLATIVFASVFAIIMNVADGARSVPREYGELAKSFRSGPLRALFDVVLPSATPYLLSGVRLAAGRALIAAVVAEFYLAIGGIGYFILYNSRTFRHSEAFVGVLLLAGFGVAFELLVAWATRRFLPWYRREEKKI
jgi:NitT/TauT family transport system permease protein